MLPGSIVMSYSWKAYDCLKDHDFQLLRVNHSLHFMDPDSDAHTNSIEGTWSAIKRSMPTNHAKGEFDSYLAEYIWRRLHHHSQKKDIKMFSANF